MTLSQRLGVVEIVTPIKAFQLPSATCSIEAYKSSFFPQTIRDWNDLPDSLFLLLKCQMSVCPSSLHSCVLISPPSEPHGEVMSFGVSPVNYSDSNSDSNVGVFR